MKCIRAVALLVFVAIVTTSGCHLHDPDSSRESAKTRAKFPAKRRVDQFLAPSCKLIANRVKRGRGGHKNEQIRKATQYFTPMFPPGRDGGLRKADQRACINIEGACIVGRWLYNYGGSNMPKGERYARSDALFKLGKGSGKSQYNTTNALDPCRTLAADKRHYPIGTVVYIPSMKQKRCPQTGKVVDGCFIVGDVGSKITGANRFDIFTGECSNYSKVSNTCRDSHSSEFIAPQGTTYYVINRDSNIAKALRQETDRFILGNWRKPNRWLGMSLNSDNMQ